MKKPNAQNSSPAGNVKVDWTLGPWFSERPIFRRNPLHGFLKHGAQSSREKLPSKILIEIVFAVRHCKS
jgi:hypothetical protein